MKKGKRFLLFVLCAVLLTSFLTLPSVAALDSSEVFPGKTTSSIEIRPQVVIIGDLWAIAEALTDVSTEYLITPIIGGASSQVKRDVEYQLAALDQHDLEVSVQELLPPEQQEDKTSFVGQYRVTLKYQHDDASRELAYTQTKIASNPSFSDVDPDEWYFTYVEALHAKGIIGGFGNTGQFRPDFNLTREQTAKMVVEGAGFEHEGLIAPFDDVDPNGWSTGYIAALALRNVVSGFGGTNEFRPDQNILRGHAAKIVALAFDLKMGDLPYTLSDLPSDLVVRESIEKLASNGIVKGFGGSNEFRPDRMITRAEFSKTILVTMAVSSIQKAETERTQEAYDLAQALINDLPIDQDLTSRAYLQARLEAIELLG